MISHPQQGIPVPFAPDCAVSGRSHRTWENGPPTTLEFRYAISPVYVRIMGSCTHNKNLRVTRNRDGSLLNAQHPTVSKLCGMLSPNPTGIVMAGLSFTVALRSLPRFRQARMGSSLLPFCPCHYFATRSVMFNIICK